MQDNENIQYDCSRGCAVSRNIDNELTCTYRPGCCKLMDADWLEGVHQDQFSDIYEVRFKNTRKGFYRNDSQQSIRTGDMVIVEAQNGHDLGIVTLEGPVVVRQMACKGVDPATAELRKIYRKARPFDIENWQIAIAREQETMIRAREIAAELGLEMKIGDVEFQGDGTKAIFYYIANGRVDFRQLIKVFAEEFRIRIEMKQIGARQEAGLIGGIGVCGRELCCANYITNFKSITTSAARCQDLSLNPQKLAGQCGKLKCCLNYEVESYTDALSRIPKVQEPLEFQDGLAYLIKTDILQETMYFSYDKNSMSNLYPLDAYDVREIIKMNRNGVKPESLKTDTLEAEAPEFRSAVGDDSISRFDNLSRKKKKKKKVEQRGAEKAGRREEGRREDNRRDEGRREENRREDGRRDEGRREEGKADIRTEARGDRHRKGGNNRSPRQGGNRTEGSRKQDNPQHKEVQ